MQNPEKEWFGDNHVTPEEKTQSVIGVFDSVADKYDVMNDFMSLGIHRLWKDHFVRMIRPKPYYKYLDVAGGTGDIAFRIRKKAPKGHICVLDLNENMLIQGRNKAFDKGYVEGFDWITGNAEELPYEDESFDIYTIAFGLRNVTHIDDALKEAHRVLKPGGRFYCLEFSHVKTPLLSQAYDLYSAYIIPTLGQYIAQDRDSYKYLVESIRKFPKPKQLVKRLLNAGFCEARFHSLTQGVACIHQAQKG